MLRKIWNKPDKIAELKPTMIQWRKEHTIERVENPSRLNRARSLGYKAKKGIIIVRVKVDKGGRKKRSLHGGGRKPSKTGIRGFSTGKSLQVISEARASKKYRNMEVMNSYLVGEDGHYKWYEVIMLDRSAPEIKNDKNLARIVRQRGRAFRGMTSAGRKGRGLRHKGKGAERLRGKRIIRKRAF